MSLSRATRREELLTKIGCRLGVLVSPLHLDERMYQPFRLSKGCRWSLLIRLEGFLTDQINDHPTQCSLILWYPPKPCCFSPKLSRLPVVCGDVLHILYHQLLPITMVIRLKDLLRAHAVPVKVVYSAVPHKNRNKQQILTCK